MWYLLAEIKFFYVLINDQLSSLSYRYELIVDQKRFFQSEIVFLINQSCPQRTRNGAVGEDLGHFEPFGYLFESEIVFLIRNCFLNQKTFFDQPQPIDLADL